MSQKATLRTSEPQQERTREVFVGGEVLCGEEGCGIRLAVAWRVDEAQCGAEALMV